MGRSPEGRDAAKALRQAAASLAAGRTADAIAQLDGVIRLDPGNGPAHHMMGLAQLRGRHLATALTAFDHAVAAIPANAEFRLDRGIARLMAGRGDDGEADLREAIALDPKLARAHFNLGLCRLQRRAVEEAIALFRETIRLEPKTIEALIHLGIALAMAGRPGEGVDSLRRAVALVPGHPLARINLANALLEAGQPGEAAEEYRRISRESPRDPRAPFGLARSLERLGRKPEAVEAYRASLAIDPRFAGAHLNLATLLERLGRLDDAEHHARQAIALLPNDIEPRLNLAQFHVRKGDLALAGAEFSALERDRRDDRRVLERLAQFQFRRVGDLQAGRETLQRLFAVAPKSVVAHELWAEDGDSAIDLDRVQRLVAWVDRADEFSAEERGRLAYCAAALLGRQGQHEQSFVLLGRAKALMAPRASYDPDHERRVTERLIATFDRRFFEERAGWGDASDRPVFVVGMPRSGTSLVEQIIASHPAMAGLGELTDFPDLVADLTALHGGEFPDALARVSEQEMRGMAARYLAKIATAPPVARRVVDKMPINFRHVGLIAVMFPNARIIHTRRNALDNCLSIYRQNFELRHPYAFDLDHLGRYYRDYQRLMTHWASVLPRPMMEIDYEALVLEFEREARRLIEGCGVAWDERVRQFHQSGHSVATASWWQVRQPLYRTAVGGWRRYERWLGPLKEALAT
ncbi:MAG: tetratricopeptide repeat protein [Alphaproteobacteria bacterium]|nr:tetratricopeptide repeat protein [Alphaproteobacteria bacterium]